jgi:hypothetical protein
MIQVNVLFQKVNMDSQFLIFLHTQFEPISHRVLVLCEGRSVSFGCVVAQESQGRISEAEAGICLRLLEPAK